MHHLSKSIVALAFFGASLTSAHAAALALDVASNAAYNTAWTTGSNGGSGFGAWTVNAPANTAAFIGNAATNGSGGSGGLINTAGESFGFFSNNGATVDAIRAFTGGPLTVGQSFKLDFDNGNIQNTGVVGFGLRSSTGNRFEFFFTGGTSSYSVVGSTLQSTAHGFTPDGMSTTFTLTAPDSFSFAVTFKDNGTTENFTGALLGAAGQTITDFRLFSFNAGNVNVGGNQQNNAFYNSPQVVPEPTSAVLLAGGLLGFGMKRRRLPAQA